MKITAILIIDLAKAFNTLDNNIVLKELFHYGLRRNNLEFPQSYLQNIKQYFASENTSKTEYKNVICDLPEG